MDSKSDLSLPEDTLTFDTVFTTLGSTTKYFKIHNTSSRSIIVSSILLAGGNASNFRLNIDGFPVNELKDVEIAPNDSLYIFVAVTVDPNNQNNPFLITDSVLFNTNGNLQKVILMAYGQNANFYNAAEICDETWTKDKPYIIINSAIVDSSCTLTIEPGTRIYLHAGSRLYVSGTLIVNGTKTDSVVFQGDRLEQNYLDVPGQWEGIHILRSSTNNEIKNAIIKNAVVGIRVDSLPENANPKLTISNSRIYNILSSGILSLTSVIEGENLVMYNCGQNNLQLEGGGFYDFTHCTLVNYNTNDYLSHQDPVIKLSNYLETGSGIYLAEMNASFTNCIIYGTDTTEIDADKYKNDNTPLNYLFDHCLVKLKPSQINSTNFINSFFNVDPLFTGTTNNDFHLKPGSPAINSGKPTSVLTDIEENPRDATPDIGAFEN